MYVAICTEKPSLWTVGFHGPDGAFSPLRDFETEQGALEFVHYLNGGTGVDCARDFATLTLRAVIALEKIAEKMSKSRVLSIGEMQSIIQRGPIQARGGNVP